VNDTENDGRFPDGSPVETPFPLGDQNAPRETWPWLAATVEHQCGPDEWMVTIEDRRTATLGDGSPAPEGTPDGDMFWPQAFRDASELRRPQDGSEEESCG
jgi:hypothetical protein